MSSQDQKAAAALTVLKPLLDPRDEAEARQRIEAALDRIKLATLRARTARAVTKKSLERRLSAMQRLKAAQLESFNDYGPGGLNSMLDRHIAIAKKRLALPRPPSGNRDASEDHAAVVEAHGVLVAFDLPTPKSNEGLWGQLSRALLGRRANLLHHMQTLRRKQRTRSSSLPLASAGSPT